MTPQDMYMNFLDASGTHDSANSSTVTSTEVATGLSIRGNLAFLIHLIEILFYDTASLAEEAQNIGISTRAGLSSVPELGDQGCIFADKFVKEFNTSGTSYNVGLKQVRYLPPVPLAAPKIVTYVATDADEVNIRSQKIHVRIGYTTEKIDSKMYTELAETWGFAN